MKCAYCGNDIENWFKIGEAYACKPCFENVILKDNPTVRVTSESFSENVEASESNEMDEFDKISQEALSEALAKQSQAQIKRHYEVLGLTTSASLEEVRERCKELVSTWHPDLYKDDPEKHKLATQKVQDFKEAYAAITKEAAKASTIIPPHQASTVNQSAQSSAAQMQDHQDTETSKSFQTKAYEAILGEKNRIHYLVKFEEFDRQAPELKASWNWSAFFFGGIWALYRKMYGWFFVFFGIAFLSTILEQTASFGLSVIVLFIPRVAFSIYANSLYHDNVKKKIAVAQLSFKDESKQLEFLRHKGGVNTWVIWLIPLFALFVGLVGGYLIYSITRDKQEVPVGSRIIYDPDPFGKGK